MVQQQPQEPQLKLHGADCKGFEHLTRQGLLASGSSAHAQRAAAHLFAWGCGSQDDARSQAAATWSNSILLQYPSGSRLLLTALNAYCSNKPTGSAHRLGGKAMRGVKPIQGSQRRLCRGFCMADDTTNDHDEQRMRSMGCLLQAHLQRLPVRCCTFKLRFPCLCVLRIACVWVSIYSSPALHRLYVKSSRCPR